MTGLTGGKKVSLKNDAKILVTGAAGFIGSSTVIRLIELGFRVVAIDNISDYYDPNLKLARINRIKAISSDRFEFLKMDVNDRSLLDKLFKENNFEKVIHMAAQAGVRYSIINPSAYVNTNIEGFFNLLEIMKEFKTVKHFVYASSSSVYGGNDGAPCNEESNTDNPLNLYAASKKSNELMAAAYSHLFDLPSTGVRLFTVYGPWGRPDMALFKFVKAILNNDEIQVFNEGRMSRDFTYIDDVLDALVSILKLPPSNRSGPKKVDKNGHHRVVNIGNGSPVSVMTFISVLEECLGKKANVKFEKHQPGDAYYTHADTTMLFKLTGLTFNTPLEKGVRSFITWYKNYYNI